MVKTRGATDNNKRTRRKATPDELATNARKRNKAGSTKSIAIVFAGSSNQDNKDAKVLITNKISHIPLHRHHILNVERYYALGFM